MRTIFSSRPTRVGAAERGKSWAANKHRPSTLPIVQVTEGSRCSRAKKHADKVDVLRAPIIARWLSRFLISLPWKKGCDEIDFFWQGHCYYREKSRLGAIASNRWEKFEKSQKVSLHLSSFFYVSFWLHNFTLSSALVHFAPSLNFIWKYLRRKANHSSSLFFSLLCVLSFINCSAFHCFYKALSGFNVLPRSRPRGHEGHLWGTTRVYWYSP